MSFYNAVWEVSNGWMHAYSTYVAPVCQNRPHLVFFCGGMVFFMCAHFRRVHSLSAIHLFIHLLMYADFQALWPGSHYAVDCMTMRFNHISWQQFFRITWHNLYSMLLYTVYMYFMYAYDNRMDMHCVHIYDIKQHVYNLHHIAVQHIALCDQFPLIVTFQATLTIS